jgi:hypothetical protein
MLIYKKRNNHYELSFPRRRESRGDNLSEEHFVRVWNANDTRKLESG